MHHEPVLVTPANSHENPPVGIRGTIRVTPAQEVEIDLQFAVMFDRPAATETIRLNADQVAALRASKEQTGGYAIALDRPLPPPPGTGFVVASPRL